MADRDGSVLMQVPVTEDLADELAYLAKAIDRSVTWLATQLLEQTLEDRKNTADRLGMMVFGLIGDAKKLVTGKRRRKPEDQKQVRIQVTVTPAVHQQIAELADGVNLTPVKMAALLLQTAVAQHGVFLEAIATKPVQALIKKARSKRTTREAESLRGKAPPA